MKINNKKPDMVNRLRSQDGSIILIAMIVIVVITVIGFTALNSTDTDFKISQNDRCFKQNLFRAEAAAFEAGAILDTEPDPSTTLQRGAEDYDWLSDGNDDSFDPIKDAWDYEKDVNASYTKTNPDHYSGFSVVFGGIAKGNSLDMDNPTSSWQYSVYGRSEQCNGRVDVGMGYKIRY
jgi:hypothetical protein